MYASVAFPELRERLMETLTAVTTAALETFDSRTTGFEDHPARVETRIALVNRLEDLGVSVRARNVAARVDALGSVGAAARARVSAALSCLENVRGAAARLVTSPGRGIATWPRIIRSCARDVSPSALDRDAAEAWLDALGETARGAAAEPPEPISISIPGEDEDDAFVPKALMATRSTDSEDVDALRAAREMSREESREAARSFVETDIEIGRIRAETLARRGVVRFIAGSAVVFAAAVVLEARKRRSRSRSRTSPSSPGQCDWIRPDASDAREADANPLEFAARQPLPETDEDGAESESEAEAEATDYGNTDDDDDDEVPVLSISSPDDAASGETADFLGPDDGFVEKDGFVEVPGDATFDQADATFRRSASVEKNARRESPRDREPNPYAFAAPSRVTVGDATLWIRGARRDDARAIECMFEFMEHPDVRARVPEADVSRSAWTDDPLVLAQYHEDVLRYVRERTSCDEAAWNQTPYVSGVLRRYAESV
jgi:hypothetical protein